MNDVTIFNYGTTAIAFKAADGSTMVNATQMAKNFGKRPIDWLRLPTTEDFLKVLKETRKSENFSQFTKTVKGKDGGTWMHEDVALEFARWLSPAFAIWCNDRIKELMTAKTNHGMVPQMQMQKAIDTINSLNEKVKEDYERRIQQLEDEKSALGYQLEYYARRLSNIREAMMASCRLLDTGDVKSTTQIAEKYGMTSQELFNKLYQNGILIKGNDGSHQLADKYKGFEMTEYRQFNERTNGKDAGKPYLAWTFKGAIFIDLLVRFNFNTFQAWDVLDNGKRFIQLYEHLN